MVSGFAAGHCLEQWPISKLVRSLDSPDKTKPARSGGPVSFRCSVRWLVCLACYRGSLVRPGLRGHSLDVGGAEEIRTPDLRRAKAALSQLSYGPSRV